MWTHVTGHLTTSLRVQSEIAASSYNLLSDSCCLLAVLLFITSNRKNAGVFSAAAAAYRGMDTFHFLGILCRDNLYYSISAQRNLVTRMAGGSQNEAAAKTNAYIIYSHSQPKLSDHPSFMVLISHFTASALQKLSKQPVVTRIQLSKQCPSWASAATAVTYTTSTFYRKKFTTCTKSTWLLQLPFEDLLVIWHCSDWYLVVTHTNGESLGEVCDVHVKFPVPLTVFSSNSEYLV